MLGEGNSYTRKATQLNYGKKIDRKNIAREFAKAIVDGYRRSGITPYRTGNLKYNGINATSMGQKAIIYIGGKPAPYAWYLEFNEFVGKTEVRNRHKGWVEKVLHQDALPYAIKMIPVKNITKK